MEVRTPGGKEKKKKKKQNRNRETFVSEAADISKNLTYTQGGGTRHRKRSHTTSLVVPWTTLSRSKLDDSSGLKGYCETTLPPDSLIFPNLPRFFFFLSLSLSLREIVTWCRHGDFSSKTNLSTWSIGQATTIRCIIQQYFISDPRYSFLPRLPLPLLLSVHGDPVFVYVCIW